MRGQTRENDHRLVLRVVSIGDCDVCLNATDLLDLAWLDQVSPRMVTGRQAALPAGVPSCGIATTQCSQKLIVREGCGGRASEVG